MEGWTDRESSKRRDRKEMKGAERGDGRDESEGEEDRERETRTRRRKRQTIGKKLNNTENMKLQKNDAQCMGSATQCAQTFSPAKGCLEAVDYQSLWCLAD